MRHLGHISQAREKYTSKDSFSTQQNTRQQVIILNLLIKRYHSESIIVLKTRVFMIDKAHQITTRSPISTGPLLDIPTSIPPFIEGIHAHTNKFSSNRTHSFTLNLGLGNIVFYSPTWADDFTILIFDKIRILWALKSISFALQ